MFGFFKRNKELPYYYIEQFLPDEIVEKLLNELNTIAFNKARQYDSGRKNKEVFLESLEYLDQFIINRKVGHKSIKLFSKPYEFYKYETEDYIEKHTDASRELGSGFTSNFTLIIYLNDNLVGGETFLVKDKIKFTPKKGSGLLFEHNLEHSGERLLYGEKYIFRTNCFLK
jgi:hypothetical protein